MAGCCGWLLWLACCGGGAAHLDCVELVAGSALQRVVQVHDDDVEAGWTLLEHGLGIIDDELEARVRERLAVLGQILAAEFHHILVDVDHHAALHSRVTEDLTRGGALSAATNVDGLWARVSKQCRVHERLMVHILVHLARLDQTIDEQRAAKGLKVDHIDRLELGGRRAKLLLEAIRDAQARLELLLNPLGHGRAGRPACLVRSGTVGA